jgi:hypothetical protein
MPTPPPRRPGLPALRRPAALCLALLFAGPACVPFDGLVAPGWLLARQHEYLAYAGEEFHPGRLLNVLANLELERRDPRHVVPAGSIPDDAWDPIFANLFALRDTSDFDMMYLLNLLYAFRGHPAASEALWQKAERAVLDFKYWFTDPTPPREVNGQPVIDNMWYWSENHILIFRTCELLAGRMFPDEVFSTSGLTGLQHAERARAEILTWLEERARWGFTEWHSNVYYNLDMLPLLTLIEWADDPVVVQRATMVLDLVWLDVALHLHRGTFGATHGRSYIKDKASASTEDTFPASKMLFDDTELPYEGRGSSSATLFARSVSYRIPEVIRRIATSDEPLEDHERMNLPIPEEPPAAYDDPVPAPPYGLDYSEDHLPLWWSMASQATWPILPLTLLVGEREGLWGGQFSDFALLRDFVWVEGDFDQTLARAHQIYLSTWKAITESLLDEVHTTTFRTRDYMLSTAQDYRKGLRGSQTHTWQATLSERALVFTTHPGYLPVALGDEIPSDWDWQREDEPGPGYWTGEGSQPRAGQHRNLAIAIYAPQYKQPLPGYGYRQETHAYFPVAHFDEVVQEGGWTFGRKDDGYVALWSFRPTSWRGGQPEVFQNGGLDFDLVAEGGATNVWVVECGSAGEWGDFAAFRGAFLAPPDPMNPMAPRVGVVGPLPDAGGDGLPDGFDVAYVSPSQGLVTFGWTAPLVVDGQEVPLAGTKRFDNPYVQVEFDDTRYEVSDGEFSLLLDFDSDTREASAPPELRDEAQARFADVWAALVAALGGAP